MAFTAGIVHPWLHMTEGSGSSAIVHLTWVTPCLNQAWHGIILSKRSAKSREYVIFSVNRIRNHRHGSSLHAKCPPCRFIIDRLTVTCVQILDQLHFMPGSTGLMTRSIFGEKCWTLYWFDLSTGFLDYSLKPLFSVLANLTDLNLGVFIRLCTCLRICSMLTYHCLVP